MIFYQVLRDDEGFDFHVAYDRFMYHIKTDNNFELRETIRYYHDQKLHDSEWAVIQRYIKKNRLRIITGGKI